MVRKIKELLMKYLSVPVALLLCACGGMTKQEFFQILNNIDKSVELTAAVQVSTGCEKLGKLYDFSKKETPSVTDLAEIMSVFNLKANDATDIDKVYGINIDSIESFHCDNVNNLEQISAKIDSFCQNQYLNDKQKQRDCHNHLATAVINNSTKIVHYINMRAIIEQSGAQDLYYEIKRDVKKNINKIYSLPDDTEIFLPVFSASELIKARKEILGTYDRYCSSSRLCEEDKKVTRLNAIRILYSVCEYSFRYLGEHPECVCFVHETYKKVNYQNLIYIDEKYGRLPESKKDEFDQIFDNCKQKLEKQRYGETSNY